MLMVAFDPDGALVSHRREPIRQGCPGIDRRQAQQDAGNRLLLRLQHDPRTPSALLGPFLPSAGGTAPTSAGNKTSAPMDRRSYCSMATRSAVSAVLFDQAALR